MENAKIVKENPTVSIRKSKEKGLKNFDLIEIFENLPATLLRRAE